MKYRNTITLVKYLLKFIQIYPERIKEVAIQVTSLPPTQVSEGRLFLALKFIKSDLWACIKEDLQKLYCFLEITDNYVHCFPYSRLGNIV